VPRLLACIFNWLDFVLNFHKVVHDVWLNVNKSVMTYTKLKLYHYIRIG
jgi:hypothetical protein